MLLRRGVCLPVGALPIGQEHSTHCHPQLWQRSNSTTSLYTNISLHTHILPVLKYFKIASDEESSLRQTTYKMLW